MTDIKSADDVLAFWTEAGPEKWYKKDDDFDRAIRESFLATYEAAIEGRLSAWQKEPRSALAHRSVGSGDSRSIDQMSGLRGTPCSATAGSDRHDGQPAQRFNTCA